MRGATIFLLFSLAAAATSRAQDVQVVRADGSIVRGENAGLFKDRIRVKTSTGVEDVFWRDVIVLGSEKPVTLEFVGGERVLGRLTGLVDDAFLGIESALLGPLRAPVGALPTFVGEATSKPAKSLLEPKDWSGHLALASTFAFGNRDILTALMDVDAERTWPEDRLKFRLRGVYGRSSSEDQSDAQDLTGRFEHRYDASLFAYASTEAGRDAVRDIELRTFVNVGAGLELWKISENELFSIEGGFGARYESFLNDTESRVDPTARVGVIWRDVLFDDVNFAQTAEAVVPLTRPGSFLARFESTFTVPLSLEWSVRSTLRVEYQGEPTGGKEPVDVLATIGLEFRF